MEWGVLWVSVRRRISEGNNFQMFVYRFFTSTGSISCILYWHYVQLHQNYDNTFCVWAAYFQRHRQRNKRKNCLHVGTCHELLLAVAVTNLCSLNRQSQANTFHRFQFVLRCRADIRAINLCLARAKRPLIKYSNEFCGQIIDNFIGHLNYIIDLSQRLPCAQSTDALILRHRINFINSSILCFPCFLCLSQSSRQARVASFELKKKREHNRWMRDTTISFRWTKDI